MSAAAWIVDALLASALLMGAVLLARGPVRRAFGPQVGYALWALPGLRLLLPPLPAGWWRAAAAAPITRAGETVVYVFEPAAAGAAPAASALPSLAIVLALVWGAGALLFLGWHVVRHTRFCRAVLADAAPLEERDGVRVVASAAAPGPLAFGVRHRVVAFPADFADRYDADERALALQHELGHHARRDLLANWLALAVLALHWFSPLAWAAFRAFRADQELANDAAVLARCGVGARHAYGRAIVKAAAPGLQLATACHLHTINDLKGRLRMLTTSTASRRRLATGSAAVTLLVAAGLGLTASGSAARQVSTTLAAPVQAAPPPAPPVPVTGEQTPTPPTPAARAGRVRHVVVVKNGKTQTYDGAAADAYLAEHHMPVPPVPPAPPAGAAPVAPPAPRIMVMRRGGDQTAWQIDMPQVTSARCPGDDRRPMVENRTEHGRNLIIVCTNRIEAMTNDAQMNALRAEAMARMAMGSARTNLALARSAIEGDRNLSAAQKAQALAGIAQAEAELRAPAE